jgi:hypothetical protein
MEARSRGAAAGDSRASVRNNIDLIHCFSTSTAQHHVHLRYFRNSVLAVPVVELSSCMTAETIDMRTYNLLVSLVVRAV